MKPLSSLAAMLVLAGCVSSPQSKSPTAADGLIGKRLSASSGQVFLLNPDGSVGGRTSAGQAIVGTYRANSTEICTKVTAPPAVSGDYCSIPVINENTVIFNRRDGTRSDLYLIEDT